MDRSFFDEYLGNALYEARVVKRITQAEMTKMTNKKWLSRPDNNRVNGFTRSTYTRYERGEISMPITYFKDACEILGLDWVQVFREAQNYEFNCVKENDDIGKETNT